MENDGEALYERIRRELEALAEPEFARFSAGLLKKPGEEELTGTAAHVMGVRLPSLRKLAKRLTREDWRGNLNALSAHVRQAAEAESAQEIRFEEVMLWGFLIGCARVQAEEAEPRREFRAGSAAALQERSAAEEPGALRKRSAAQETVSLREQFALVREFVPYIDNWSLCDSFCAGLKSAREYPAQTWDFLQPFLRSEKEYEIRFGIVMLLNYFVTEEYADALFPVFDAVRCEGYYVKMAVAWAVSVCYVKFPDRTERYLENNRLDDFTYNKALQKIVESRCVSEEVRARMRGRKRRTESRR